MSNYYLKLHIENPGTMHTAANGQLSQSSQGHVWYELIRPDGSSLQAGFGPQDPKSSLSSVQGEVFYNDGAAYAGNPYFTATYRISADQAVTLEAYRFDPTGYGFDRNNYHALTNSCVDFVWRGLASIGMNPTGFEGDLKPVDNADDFARLRNPEFSDGGLVMIERNHGQHVEYGVGGGWVDMSWGDVINWGGGVDVYYIDDMPSGSVGVGDPITLWDDDTDGTNYNNKDGVTYQ